MKVGILTQPLHSNYGGLLQAWALQRTLVKMGHKTTIINRVWDNRPSPLWRKTASKIKNEILILLGKRKRYITVTDELKNFSEQNVLEFRQNRYLGISPQLKSNEEFEKYIGISKFDAYIVGSDQVWRPRYSPNLMTYFLDFAKDNKTPKKIAYAASFGVDYWEFSDAETVEAAKLAPLFDLITVRESSGVDLVKKYLKCNATHVLDPTMLLDKEDYIGLVENPTSTLQAIEGDLFCYILDRAKSVTDVIDNCSSSLSMKPFYCNYKTPLREIEKDQEIDDCIVPPVEQWLKSFMDAKMVVTDSFHGVVFSIIFNKPFWVVANIDRGASRFISLLKQFNLENRIVDDITVIDWLKPIDWNYVNTLHMDLMKKSKFILLSKLK